MKSGKMQSPISPPGPPTGCGGVIRVRIAHVCAALLLLAGSVCAQDVLTAWDHSNVAFCFKRAVDGTVTNCSADTILPSSWVSSNLFLINDDMGSPQYWELFLDVEGFGASQGLPTIKALVTTARRSGVRGYVDYNSGDSTYFVPTATAINDTCRLHVSIPITGGDYAQLWFWNSGDTVLFNVDSSYVWMKH